MAYWVVRNSSGHSTSIARCTRRTVRVCLSLSRLFIATLLTTGRHVRRVSPPSFPPWRLDPHPWRRGGLSESVAGAHPACPAPKMPLLLQVMGALLSGPCHAMPPSPSPIYMPPFVWGASVARSLSPQGGGDGTREISKVESI